MKVPVKILKTIQNTVHGTDGEPHGQINKAFTPSNDKSRNFYNYLVSSEVKVYQVAISSVNEVVQRYLQIVQISGLFK